MSELLRHPDRAALLAAATGPTDEISRQSLERHLVECESCRSESVELRRQWSVYVIYHNDFLKQALPAPPRPWEDLRERMLSPTWSTAVVRRPSPSAAFRWAGVAAAVAIALLWGWQHLRQPQSVSAAELLKQAVASAPPTGKARKIVIRTRRQTLVRPAVTVTGSASASDAERSLRSQFAAARYSWENPLSATSYQQWHDSLPSCTDRVDEVPPAGDGGEALYRISTSTEAGPLRHATISLRRADLSPVTTRLEFSDETVEISVLSGPEPVAPIDRVTIPSAGPATNPAPASPSPADELHVLGVLHSLGADLGEPIVIERAADAIRVSTFGLPPERTAQLKEALGPISQVRLEISDSRSASPPTGPSANPGSDRILELSDSVMARAFAASALARRFPHEVSQQFRGPERDLLHAMLLDHGRAMDKSLVDLAAVLRPRLPAGLPASPAGDASNWQESAARVLIAARRLDQALNRAFASRAESKLDEVADAMAQLQQVAIAHRKHWETPQ